MNLKPALLLVVAGCALALPSAAQEYPSKPVRIIIGFPPGGATDLVVRRMAPKYSGLL